MNFQRIIAALFTAILVGTSVPVPAIAQVIAPVVAQAAPAQPAASAQAATASAPASAPVLQPQALSTQAAACVVTSKNVSSINNKTYNSLEDAFEAIRYDTSTVDGYGNTVKKERPEGTQATVTLTAGATITLTNHIEVLHDITLDLNGGTITVDFGYTTDAAYVSDHSFAMGFLVSGGASNHGKLTVRDTSSAATGKMVLRAGGELIRCQGGGAVTVQSGTYEIPSDSEGRYLLECLGGHLTVEGGTFSNSRTDQPSVLDNRTAAHE